MINDNDKYSFVDMMDTSKKPFGMQYKDKYIIMSDVLIIEDESTFEFRIESTNSDWKQAIELDFDGTLIFKDLNDETLEKGTILWEDTIPECATLSFKCKKPTELYVNNLWEDDRGLIASCYNGSAMYFEDLKDGTRRYYCNDGQFNDDFDDLVFTMKRIDQNGYFLR